MGLIERLVILALGVFIGMTLMSVFDILAVR